MSLPPKAPPVYKPGQMENCSQQLKQSHSLQARPAPPVYRPAVAVQQKNASTLQVETRPAPAVYRPEPLTKAPVAQRTAAPGRAPVAYRAINAVSENPRTIQPATSKKGKMGASYFTQSKNEDDIARRQKAEEELGLTSAHGSSTGGKDSGISQKTLTEEARIVEHVRQQKEQEYKASRPKATIHNAVAMSDAAKALQQVRAFIAEAEKEHGKGTSAAMAQAQEKFEEYLERRKPTLSTDELDELYTLFAS